MTRAIKSRELIPTWARHVLEDLCDSSCGEKPLARPMPSITVTQAPGADNPWNSEVIECAYSIEYTSPTACPITGVWRFTFAFKDYMLAGVDSCKTPCGQDYTFGDDDPYERLCRHDQARLEKLLMKVSDENT